ncbi:MAG: hypothetical protein O2800_02835 [Planctomycetota bacterium]|nr:hypothetical protein [Planctomycetota bacterium]
MNDHIAELCGISPTATDHELLGVSPEAPRERISSATEWRLRQVAAHPDSKGPAGVAARTRIVQAARRVMRAALARERASPNPPTETHAPRSAEGVDRQVREMRSILQRYRGWNDRSRRHIMSWAARRGLNADELRSILARAAGSREGENAARPSSGLAPSTSTAAMDGLMASIDVVVPMTASSRWTTTTVMALAVALSVGAGVIAWNVIFATQPLIEVKPTETTASTADSRLPTAQQEQDRPDAVVSTPTPTPTHATVRTEGTARKNESPVIPAPAPQNSAAASFMVQWQSAADSTWLTKDGALSAEQVMSRLERTHALLQSATLFGERDLLSARTILDSIPHDASKGLVSAVLPVQEAPDHALSSGLKQAGSAASSREKALGNFRVVSGSRIGAEDAAALASAAMSDSNNSSRTLAQTLILDRLTASPTMSLALVEALPLARRSSEVTGFIGAYTGRSIDVSDDQWREWATKVLSERAIAAIEAPSLRVDRLAESLRATIAHRAALMGASESRTESSSSAEEAATLLLVRVATVLSVDERAAIDRNLSDRMRAAIGPPQRFEAVQWALVEAGAARLRHRWPLLIERIDAETMRADQERATAATILDQLAVDASVLLRLESLSMKLEGGGGGAA